MAGKGTGGKKVEIEVVGRCCSEDLSCRWMWELASFVFSELEFIEVLQSAFFYCKNQEEYESKFETFVDLYKDNYDTKKFSRLIELLRKFFDNSVEIDNDRGCVVEKLALLAAFEKKPLSDQYNIQKECKVAVSYKGRTVKSGPMDIDVCADKLDDGLYLECKMALRPESKKDVKKVKRIVDLQGIFGEIQRDIGYTHDMYIFMFKFEEERIKGLKNIWPDVNFMFIPDFIEYLR